MSRLYLVLHSVIMMVKAGGYCLQKKVKDFEFFLLFCFLKNKNKLKLNWTNDQHQISTTKWEKSWVQRGLLTEVQSHADEDDEAKPGIEVSDEVEDGNYNISNGWKNAEHNVAVRKTNKHIVNFIFHL